eukprot:664285-Amphidinium_carterae.1
MSIACQSNMWQRPAIKQQHVAKKSAGVTSEASVNAIKKLCKRTHGENNFEPSWGEAGVDVGELLVWHDLRKRCCRVSHPHA